MVPLDSGAQAEDCRAAVPSAAGASGSPRPAAQGQAPIASGWALGSQKRVFDLLLAMVVVCLAAPIMLVTALLIRATSRGPVIFRQKRLGKDAREFELLKFRSMRDSKRAVGSGLTCANDSRVTPVGRFLRHWKLDELPQLFNVICGDMSWVGPRPDLPEYFAEAGPNARRVLTLRPGITGWATLRYRNEEQLLAAIPPDELKDFYIRVHLPRKARLDLVYGKRATFCVDLWVLLRTCRIILE